MDNFDMSKLMSMLSKMDKKDLEKGIAQASQILNSKDRDEILKTLKKQGKQYDFRREMLTNMNNEDMSELLVSLVTW